MLERSTLSCQSKDKGHPFRVLGVLSAMAHIFSETAMQARTLASNRQAKAIKEPKVRSKVPKAQATVKH